MGPVLKVCHGCDSYQYDASWKENPQLSWVSRGRSTDEAYCQYCQCYINIRRDGLEALLIHTDLESHQFIMNYKRDGRVASRDISASTEAKADLTERAEILWCLQVAAAGYPYHTANNTDLFSAMFVDSKIAKNIVVGRSKLKYEINKGINPYLLEQILKPITKDGNYYVLHFEESITDTGKRCLDIYARFWHDIGGKVANVQIGSHGMKRYDSEQTYTKCLDALAAVKLPLKQLVYVSTHRTGGDLEVFRRLEEAITSNRGVPLIETLPFNENVIYTGYGRLLHVVANWGLEDLVYDLRAWFCTCKEPDAPFLSLLEVFTNEDLGHQNERFANNSLVNDPTPKSSYRINDALIYKHTLGLNKSFADVLANWPCLVKYFQNYVPNSERGVQKVPRFQRLHAAFTNPLTLLRVTFLRSVGKVLEDFMDSSIGMEGPSIHVLSGAVSTLIKDIGGRFLKAEPKADIVRGMSHIKYEEREEQLPNDMMNIGAPPGALFREIPALKLAAFYAEVRGAYAILFGYLLENSPIMDPVVRGCRALDPLKRTDKCLYTAMKSLAESVPQVVHPPTLNKVLEEWDLYQTLEIEEIQSNETVEDYWDRIFKITALGEVSRFGKLSKLIQVMLCIYYRSPNKERSLRSLEHRRATKIAQEFVNLQCSGKVSDVNMTAGLIAAYKEGWEKYSAHYSNKGLAQSAKYAVGSGIIGEGVNMLLGADITNVGYHGIREVEFICSEGVSRIEHGLKKDNSLEVNAGMALVEEARSKIRVIRSKIIHREYIRELDNNNRLLSIGLYRLKQSRNTGKEGEGAASLEVIKRGMTGISDLRMDLRPETAAAHVVDE
ncbi:uncharacterized protein LOC134815949 isoform X2 [Bolinopsis microptera]|uniref:uncharacterized protein LOC134815949 isoform X2 n=1 Tax=Bolinopsis microptera TaxID=2820187 RepID=UPI003079406A